MVRHIKLVVVGDGGVHVSELLTSYTTDDFTEESYVPTVIGNLNVDVNVAGEEVDLQLWNNQGQEDYKKLRPLTYPQTDIFIYAFSLVSPTSLENIENMWVPEVRETCPDTPCILVGTKMDMRNNFSMNEKEYQSQYIEPVSTKRGEQMMEKIKAQKYIECNVYDRKSVHKVFDAALRIALNKDETEQEKDLLKIAIYGKDTESKKKVALKYILGDFNNGTLPVNEDDFIKIIDVNHKYRKLTVDAISTDYQFTDINGIIFMINVAIKESLVHLKQLFHKINTNGIPSIIVAYNNVIKNEEKGIENLVPIAEIENLSDEFKYPLFMVTNESDDDIEDAFFYLIKRISEKIKNQSQPIKKSKKVKNKTIKNRKKKIKKTKK